MDPELKTYLEAMEAQLKAHVSAECEKVETRLLGEFFKLGRTSVARKIKLPDDLKEFFREQGRQGGKKGTAARMKTMTPEQRSEVARKAAAASAKVRSAKAANMAKAKNAAAVALGRLGGKTKAKKPKGLAALTPAKRKAIADKGLQARRENAAAKKAGK